MDLVDRFEPMTGDRRTRASEPCSPERVCEVLGVDLLLWGPGGSVAGGVSSPLPPAQFLWPALRTSEMAVPVGSGTLEMLAVPGTAGVPSGSSRGVRAGEERNVSPCFTPTGID